MIQLTNADELRETNGTGTGTFVMAGGTFHEGAGTTTGTAPVLTDTHIDYTGSGASTLTARGASAGVLSGNISTGQTLQLFSDCSVNTSRTVASSFTNAGTIILDTVSCNNSISCGTYPRHRRQLVSPVRARG